MKGAALLRTLLSESRRQLKKREQQKWSQEEIDFVLKHIGPMSDHEVARRIGRNVNSVRKWVQRYDNIKLHR